MCVSPVRGCETEVRDRVAERESVITHEKEREREGGREGGGVCSLME